MSTKRFSLAIIGSIFIGSGMAWSDLQPLATPAADSRIDFNRVFANFVPRGEFNSSFHDQLRNIGWNLIGAEAEHNSGSLAAENVNRARKGDRLQKPKAVVLERIRLPGCEPVASPFADPILGHIVGRCDA
jgi:hypothetical protein